MTEGLMRTLPPRSTAPLVLRARDVQAPPAVRDISLEVHSGEVLGIYGELGAGHSEITEILFGRRAAVGGALNILGHTRRRPRTEALRELGVVYIPSDRRSALALGKPVAANASLAALHHITGPWLRRGPENEVLVIGRARARNSLRSGAKSDGLDVGQGGAIPGVDGTNASPDRDEESAVSDRSNPGRTLLNKQHG
ncbi:ATP-binding cassette domain-containing protein [Streptomyces sp. NPDC001978]|uniref:ATP-binding cassette domain-containing protein n=1 Tax=Streptomyces sp. NPDC001978 TaxID=3364627 RepID=UPI0036BCC747